MKLSKKITNIEKLLAQNLRGERKTRGWSRKELARRADGLSEAIIVKSESHISFPTAKNLARMAKALGIEPYELLMPEKDLNLLRAVKNSIGKRRP